MALHNDDMDAETAALIARLTLEDIEDLESSRKGKARYDTPLDDAEIALRTQAEHLQVYLRGLEDLEFARNLDRAIETDADLLAALSVVALGERDDHQAALALSQGLPLPEPSDAQRALENLLPMAPSSSGSSADDTETGSFSSSRTVSPTSNLFASSTSRRVRPECTICLNPCPVSSSYHAPCNHYYCPECLRDLVEAATRDESLFPLKCCKQNFPSRQILPYLKSNFNLLNLFQAKSVEFGMPSNLRVYCPNPRCSTFLGSSDGAIDNEMVCNRCYSTVCTSCKNAAHWGETCTVVASNEQLQTLAKSKQWQTCPGCQTIVELNTGCFHITCRCRTEFCYLCAVRWKNCTCRQWDEDRLLDTAEQRVVNQFGERAAIAAPALHEQRVRDRIDRLRNDHVCAHYGWRYRRGQGNCESCGFFLPIFLLMCPGCNMLACVRCTRNRL